MISEVKTVKNTSPYKKSAPKARIIFELSENKGVYLGALLMGYVRCTEVVGTVVTELA